LKKTFVTNLALLLFVNLLIKPFWIFSDLTVQVTVGAREYGIYASLFSFSIILNILLDFGITNFNSRNIAQNKHLLQKYFSNVVVLKFLLGCLYAILSFGIAFVLQYSARDFEILGLLVFNQFLLSFILYLRSNLTGLHLFKADSFVSVTDRTIAILLCWATLLLYDKSEPFKIEWFIYVQTIAYIITFSIAFAMVLRKAEFLKIRLNLPFLYVIVKQSFPFALLILLMSLYTRVDIVMLERLLPDGDLQAGVYVQAFRILDAVTMFGLLFANILLPMFSGMIKRKESIEQLSVLSFFLIMVPTLVFSIGSVFYGKEIMELLYNDHVGQSTEIYKVLILGFIAFSTTYIFGTLLTANSSLRLLNYMAAGGMVLNIVLNFILIPQFQAWGAALASLMTQTATAVIQLLMAAYIFKFSVNIKNVARFLLFTGSLVAIFYSSQDFTQQWYYNFTSGVLAGSLSSLLFGIINPSAIVRILRKGDDF
jgi:O-antigen/teichoic acid export membrane protein